MKFTTSTAVFVLATIAPLASAATCSHSQNRWSITASGVDDVPGKCGGLWDNLKRFGACAVSGPSCGGSNGNLAWSFTTGVGCNAGMVESSWWQATKNQFGSISCP
ncbi:hypothetical protein CMEL01_11357 [Colletotrichum melonis]|uniref:Uncharacterized protein n=3 Tax=Colletotrichum acutatum species complex TaxID=2707335 RepID=A0AAI9V296_9PEZI|nr:hypothetical protein CLIM01_02369 [Colletotrichum limetticola]KAK1467364.1 hypothetical protein CMEL01_11357 [Colletotrichum melonis]KAK1494099.1 hypothetical protein CCUS01_13766 [Colletotrichum cuscutae]